MVQISYLIMSNLLAERVKPYRWWSGACTRIPFGVTVLDLRIADPSMDLPFVWKC